MAASITDLLDRVTDSTTGRPVIGALASPGKAIGAPSVTLQDATNWTTTTAIHFSIYKTIVVAGVTIKDPTTQTDWKGTLSGSTISNLTLTGGVDRAYVTGDIIELTPTARFSKDLYDLIISFANQDGSLKAAAVSTALGLGNASANGWTPVGQTFAYTGNTGQKSFTGTFAADVTGYLQPGHRLQFTRTSTPPTQAIAVQAASSQFATKASPTGITFTGPFTLEAWVYVNSYAQIGHIISRADNSTGGFALRIDTSGRLSAYYGSASNFTETLTQMSVPLKRWVHVSASVTPSTKATSIYFNGTIQPTSQIASNSTALTQVGQLTIGSVNNGIAATYFDGYVAEARIWSVAQTQATIQANMGLNCVGTESNLVACYPGAGNFNDKTANANNLTASGGAIATQASYPFKPIEYGIITAVGTFSGGLTPITFYTGNSVIPSNQAFTGVQYSNIKSPFGFPTNKDYWTVEVVMGATYTQTNPTSTTLYNLGQFQILIPLGAWDVNYYVDTYTSKTSAGVDCYSSLSTSTSAQTDPYFGDGSETGQTPMTAGLKAQKSLILTADTTHYLLLAVTYNSVLQLQLWGIGSTRSGSFIRAVCSYL